MIESRRIIDHHMAKKIIEEKRKEPRFYWR